jgi:hypothetical protein
VASGGGDGAASAWKAVGRVAVVRVRFERGAGSLAGGLACLVIDVALACFEREARALVDGGVADAARDRVIRGGETSAGVGATMLAGWSMLHAAVSYAARRGFDSA